MTIIFEGASPKEEKAIADIFEQTLTRLNQPKQVEISVTFLDEEEIAQLNEQYRDEPKETDVLSFPMLDIVAGEILDESFDADVNLDTGDYILGDVFICRTVVEKQAQENGHSDLWEICYLSVHSLLHLLGYDHAEQEEKETMFNLQDTILKASNIQ